MPLPLDASPPKHVNLLLHATKPFCCATRPTMLQPISRPVVEKVSASALASIPLPTVPTNSLINPSPSNPLSNSTRTVSALLASVVCASELVLNALHKFSRKAVQISAKFQPTPEELAYIRSLRENLACAAGPLFFAALKDRPTGYLNTPLTVVAAGMSKWLDIYSGVLMVRVLLSWFPNIPWDRQPLSAIRDLCDPYLNLFRNIIPPVFGALDVSPLLAFAVLGTLGSILNNTRGRY